VTVTGPPVMAGQFGQVKAGGNGSTKINPNGDEVCTNETCGEVGRWLAVLVLISAFAAASLLTMAAVARRAAEFGVLKALGWRTQRIVAQVLSQAAGPGAPTGELDPATASHVVAFPVHPSVTASVIVLAVPLAVTGGLLAGAFGSWRIARLRPADALARVA